MSDEQGDGSAARSHASAFILELTATPGERDDLMGKVRAFFDALAGEDGFLAAHVHAAVEEPDLIVAYEA